MDTPQWKRSLQPAGVMACRAGVGAFTAEPTEGRQAMASGQLKNSGEKSPQNPVIPTGKCIPRKRNHRQ